jgi:hypothetical protein
MQRNAAWEPLLTGGFRGFRSLFGPVGAVGLPLDLQNDGPVHQAVQEGHGQRHVTEIVAPGLEVDVGNQGGGVLLAAGVDDLVEQAGGLAALGAFDPVADMEPNAIIFDTVASIPGFSIGP